MKHHFGIFMPAAALLLLLVAPAVQAQTNMYLDFDDDNDPWTLRQDLPLGTTSALVKFVLEVGPNPPLGVEFWGRIDEGCCNWIDYMHYYGTLARPGTLQFDPLYLSFAEIGYPTCLECCPSVFTGMVAPAAPLVSGQRYFVAQVQWDAFCNVICGAPSDFALTLLEGIGGVSHMMFRCPPVATDSQTWGRLKAVYR